jgi:hypothetical protein
VYVCNSDNLNCVTMYFYSNTIRLVLVFCFWRKWLLHGYYLNMSGPRHTAVFVCSVNRYNYQSIMNVSTIYVYACTLQMQCGCMRSLLSLVLSQVRSVAIHDIFFMSFASVVIRVLIPCSRSQHTNSLLFLFLYFIFFLFFFGVKEA